MSKMVVEDVLRERRPRLPAEETSAPFSLVSLRPDDTLAVALRKLHGTAYRLNIHTQRDIGLMLSGPWTLARTQTDECTGSGRAHGQGPAIRPHTHAHGMEQHSSNWLQRHTDWHKKDLALYLVETDGRADMFNTRVDHLAGRTPAHARVLW